jgi:hypothetical protein
MTSPPDGASTIRAMLQQAGLSPSETEIAALAEQHAALKSGIELLYAIPAVRYESPALIFDAAPRFAEWSEPPPERLDGGGA